jgi:hypothetical protein
VVECLVSCVFFSSVSLCLRDLVFNSVADDTNYYPESIFVPFVINPFPEQTLDRIISPGLK